VLWASAGRSPQTAARAATAGLTDTVSVAELAARSDVLLSVCPPHVAVDVADAAAGFGGVYVDANAVSPMTARTIAERVEAGGARFVDGGIIGPPPTSPGRTRLYLSGRGAGDVAALFAGTAVEAFVLDGGAGAASALKMVFAAWTKGSSALLLAIRAAARSQGVEDALVAEWSMYLPDLVERSEGSARGATRKGWRWVREMEEIAATFADAGLPPGFHDAAAEVYRRAPRGLDGDPLDPVLRALLER
jgi:3-hydroxyisobutyrate dehydrogenase-like beta-hydroxyacid dehydrogenase